MLAVVLDLDLYVHSHQTLLTVVTECDRNGWLQTVRWMPAGGSDVPRRRSRSRVD